MRTSDRTLFTIIKRAMVSISIGIMCILLCFSDTSFAASAKDKKKQTAPSSTQTPSETAPAPTATPIDNNMKLDINRPLVIIDHFKKKVDVAPGTMMGTLPGLSPPDSATVQFGEMITLQWGIKGCNLEEVSATIDHESVPLAWSHTTSDGCAYYKGEKSFTLNTTTTTTYRLTVDARPFNLRISKDFTVNVARVQLDIPTPVVNNNTFVVTLFARNIGNADLPSSIIIVNWEVEGIGESSSGLMPYYSTGNTFYTPPLSINKGQRTQVATFELDRQKAWSYAQIQIRVELDVRNFPYNIHTSNSFVHTWPVSASPKQDCERWCSQNPGPSPTCIACSSREPICASAAMLMPFRGSHENWYACGYRGPGPPLDHKCRLWCWANEPLCSHCSKLIGCGSGYKQMKSFTGSGIDYYACERTAYTYSSEAAEAECENYCNTHKPACVKCDTFASCGYGYTPMKSFGFGEHGDNWFACERSYWNK